MPDTLSVGRIPFLVCAPFFHQTLPQAPPVAGLESVTFREGPPSSQNLWLRQGLVDLSPTSSFEYASRNGYYKLLPGLCTAGRLEIRSVRLFSRRPWSELQGQPVRLSQASATSNALFRILSKQVYRVSPLLIDAETPPMAIADLQGQVAIGDEALRLAQSGVWPYSFDLATEWQAWQGLPFAFGLWLVRQEITQSKSQLSLLKTYAQHLHASIAAFHAHPKKALEQWLLAYPTTLPLPEILDFYTSATDYTFTQAHAASLNCFFALAHEQGLIAEVTPLRFVDFL
jgi:chorismate dehydratase